MTRGIKNSSPPCKEENCNKTSAARGWCWAHYLRWYRHGDLNLHYKSDRHGHASGTLSTGSRRRSPEWIAWASMKQRCNDPNSSAWGHYGGRGITVCQEWQQSFSTFLAHVGPHPGAGYSLDRINTNRGYEPGNVRWADWETQLRNRRDRKRIGWRVGIWLPVEWDDRLGFKRGTVAQRLRLGWTVERALTQPIGKKVRVR
jgi:hypothetical protein